MTLDLRLAPLHLGPYHEPAPGFTNMTDPARDGFTGINLAGRIAMLNRNRSGQADKHTTMGTRRDEPKGTTVYSAFDWYWADQGPLSGWCLVWQNQQYGSPVLAISPTTDMTQWFANSRDGTRSTKVTLGPILRNRWANFLCRVTIADKPTGSVEVWGPVYDRLVDPSKDPVTLHRTGIQTYQGAVAHETLGMYASHTKTGVYEGFFSRYGRGATAAKALVLAA